MAGISAPQRNPIEHLQDTIDKGLTPWWTFAVFRDDLTPARTSRSLSLAAATE